MKVALVCGGPSLERGISLNSARSVLDHLSSDKIEIIPFYFDSKKNPYQISISQLYSNTPSDFDFKLKQTASPLTEQSLIRLLKKTDISFPVMHGPFGEDGQIQSFFEKNKIPFVGSSSKTCQRAFDKYIANEFIKQQGFFGFPSDVLKIHHHNHRQVVNSFFKKYDIKRAVVKPATGGSSIGVFSVATPEEALEKAKYLFSKKMDTRVVIEPFVQGIEFTVIILKNRFGLPVALVPTEIEADYTKHQIFDYRKKYLPTRQVTYHCPPRFSNETIETIQAQAEQLFSLLEMEDFGRFDGWVLPDNKIWFSDFNPISGMEQNSFLFQQASRVGMSHKDILKYIIKQACYRYRIDFPEEKNNNSLKTKKKRKPINILFGGDTSERQVSLMSGTNTWLKLRNSKKYEPQPYLWDMDGRIWHLPYHLTLNHTVEEIIDNCRNYQTAKERLGMFERRARVRLDLSEDKDEQNFFEPISMTLDKFIENSNFIFIALHGGDGENGNLQKILTEQKVKFNGPDERVSRLGIDKWKTAQFIKSLKIKGLNPIPKKLIKTKYLFKLKNNKLKYFWQCLLKELNANTIIVKPRDDGCSSGVVHLFSSNELRKYIEVIKSGATSVSKNTFKNQNDILEMPLESMKELLFEKFIETDVLGVKGNRLYHYEKSNWLETTIGVIQDKNKLRVFNPSITVAEGEVLTVEEKFQGGTGVNITPPPETIMNKKTLNRTKSLIGKMVNRMKLKGYSRIDTFTNIKTGDLLIIEMNTLPALTPSTVLYHQALTEKPPIFPRSLLEKLVENTGY